MSKALQENNSMCYRIKQGYVLRSIADEYVAVPVAMQDSTEPQIVVMNESGRFIWEHLETGRTITDLVKVMTDQYEVSQDEAEADIREFLEYLDQNHLIVTEEMK